ncbi:MAG: hypothetical protein P4M13_01280 [Alphaproteobacteria bacterium]|nr:hypothetical protein [Alphaproteobacteria bacterium]
MSHEKITSTQMLLPLFLLSFVVVAFLGFQTSALVGDRTALGEAYTQQEKPLEEVGKVKTQVNALAVGTLKLSQQGDKNAETIIEQLKKAGIDVRDQPSAQPGAGAPPSPALAPSK